TNRPVAGQNMIVALGQLDAASEMASNGEISAETAYCLQQLPQYFGEPEGTNGPVYVGALICALFLVGCIIVRGPLKWVLVVLTIFSILLALGRNCMWLTDLMIDYMPMYNKFRTPESILVIAEFTMPLLAVMGLQKLLELPGRESWDRYRKAILAGFGITGFFCLVGILAPAIYGSGVTDMEKEMGVSRMPELYRAIEQLRYGMVRSDALRSLLFIALGFGALMLYFRKVVTVGVTVLFVGLVTAADLLTVNKRYLNSDSFMPAPLTNDEVFVASPADQAILTDTAMNYRVLDMKRFMSAEPSYYHKAIGGYHAAKLTRYQDMLEYFFLSGEHNPDNMLNMLNTRYIIQDPQQMPSINIGAMGNAWLVDKLDYVDSPDAEIAAVETLDLEHNAVADRRYESVLGKAQPKLQGDTIFETSYAPNRLTYHVDTKHGGVAVFSEVYFPWGWHATIDGKPAELGRVNYILRALRVPAGSHTIEMWFDPESLHTTTTIARVAIIGIYLLIVAAVATGLIRRKKKPTDDKPTDGSETLEV
ncbi:MAG: YfhO family protein, partial [Paramuribaculum sp.]|nr:YfhO family protein [Paramuribaculum sp.]